MPSPTARLAVSIEFGVLFEIWCGAGAIGTSLRRWYRPQGEVWVRSRRGYYEPKSLMNQ